MSNDLFAVISILVAVVIVAFCLKVAPRAAQLSTYGVILGGGGLLAFFLLAGIRDLEGMLTQITPTMGQPGVTSVGAQAIDRLTPWVIHWIGILDSFCFVPLYALLLAIIFARAQQNAANQAAALAFALDEKTDRNGQDYSRGFLSRSKLVGGLGIWPRVLVAGLAIVDLLENYSLYRHKRSSLSQIQSLSQGHITQAKVVLAAITLLVAALMLFPIVEENTRRLGEFVLGTLFRLRAPLAVTALFVALMLSPIQTPDVFRRVAQDYGAASLAAVSSVILGLLSFLYCLELVHAPREPQSWLAEHWQRVPNHQLLKHVGMASNTGPTSLGSVLLFLGGLALFVVGFVAVPGLRILGLMLAALGVLGLLFTGKAPNPHLATAGASGMPRLLAVTPMLALGLAAQHAELADVLYRRQTQLLPGVMVLIVCALIPSLLSVGAFFLLGKLSNRPNFRGNVWTRHFLGLVVLLGVGIWVWIGIDVWEAAQALGSIAVIATFCTLAIAATGQVSLAVERRPPTRFVAALGVRRTPVFVLMLIWLLAARQFAGDDFHDIQRIKGSHPTVQASETLDGWIARHSKTRNSGTRGTRRVMPMVFVATDGGGIKAAVWTTDVLDCVLHGGSSLLHYDSAQASQVCKHAAHGTKNRTPDVFAASGISGGSLGLVEYTAQQSVGGGAARPGWIEGVLGEDFVAPSIAWQLFAELPRAFLRFGMNNDRADVLQEGWEHAWVDSGQSAQSPLQRGFFSEQKDNPQLPLLMLNGSTVEGGCRFVVSPLATAGDSPPGDCSRLGQVTTTEANQSGSLFAASTDLSAFLCPDEDVSMSTAVLLSARFPYVSPAGEVRACPPSALTAQVVDGGYLDGSGGLSVYELWSEISREVTAYNEHSPASCIVPYLLQISSGYLQSTGTSKPVSQVLVPPSGFMNAKGSRSTEGRNLAALAFLRGAPGGIPANRYALLYLHSHPGQEAPLGWTLSQAGFQELDHQLVLNQTELEKVGNWFGPQTCSR